MYRKLIGRVACVLQRLPGDFKQEPLLRVDLRRLARRDSEEVRVKAVHLLEKAAAVAKPCRPFSHRPGGTSVMASTPSRSNCQSLDVLRARKATGHPDDGDWLFCGAFVTGRLGHSLLPMCRATCSTVG